MIVEIVTTGSELLFGLVINTNVAYMSARLNELGFDVVYQTTVCDYHDPWYGCTPFPGEESGGA